MRPALFTPDLVSPAADCPKASGDDGTLIDAVVAVNDARSLGEALTVLAETVLGMVGAARISVTVWSDDFSSGVIRAAAGMGSEEVGQRVQPSHDQIRRLRERSPFLVSGKAVAAAVGPELAKRTASLNEIFVVPLALDELPPVTLQAAWSSPMTEEELERASDTLRIVGRLTRIAYRADQERETARERARLEALIDAVADGVWLQTSGGMTLNRSARRLLHLSDGDPVSEEDLRLRFLDGTPVTAAALAEAIARDDVARLRLRATRRDGRERVFDASISAIHPAAGEEEGVVCLFRDVTDDHNENFLTERLLEQLFDALPTAVRVSDPVTREIRSMNRAFLDLVGYEPDELLGLRPPYPWWAHPERFRRDDDWSVPFEDGAPLQEVFRHRDGRLIPVELVPFTVFGPGGEPVALVALITDLSDRRRFEQQLVQSGKLATIGELAAGVAHEINNPLFAILGLVEFLLKDAAPGTKARERLELVQQTGLEIKEIVRALLDFARERSDEWEVISLADVVQQTVELVQRTSSDKAIEIVERYDGDSALVEGSPNQLKQILLNLLTNARQAMPEGGTITVDVRRDGSFAAVEVSDTGPGIPEEVLPRIFEPFFTTKRHVSGTGLGLSVSLGLAEAHRGTLTAESPHGAGATFTLRLPYAPEAAS